MNVLILGPGHGSFIVRGLQLGTAIGARIAKKPTAVDLAWADVVVLVKWAGWDLADVVHRAGKPIVWDALDFWRQPDQNGYSESEAHVMLAAYLRHIKPTLTIGATQAMASVCGGVYLPHHARPGLTPRPVKEDVTIVAYEGVPKYLGRWAKAIQDECDRRNWVFWINPPDLSVADIIVAFRDGKWDGWMCRNWKSGVKIVNAMAVGRPIITQDSAAFTEIAPVGTIINSPEDISLAFEVWTTPNLRQKATQQREFRLESIANEYRAILESVAVQC